MINRNKLLSLLKFLRIPKWKIHSSITTTTNARQETAVILLSASLESDVLTSTSLITEPTTAAPMHKTQSLKWGGCVTHNAAAVPTAKCVFPVISFPFSFPKICNLEVFLILPRLPESQPFYYTLPHKSWQAIPPKFRCFSCIYALLDL